MCIKRSINVNLSLKKKHHWKIQKKDIVSYKNELLF